MAYRPALILFFVPAGTNMTQHRELKRGAPAPVGPIPEAAGDLLRLIAASPDPPRHPAASLAAFAAGIWCRGAAWRAGFT